MTSRPDVTQPATPSYSLVGTAPLPRVPGAIQRAFDRADARLAYNPRSDGVENELVAFMRSSTLDTPRRLRAASRLLVIAEDTANAALAVLVYHDLLSIVPSDDDVRGAYSQALLIYHGAFGSRVDAVRLAREMIASCNRESHSWSRLQAKINATHALQIVGGFGEVVAQLEACYAQLVAAGGRASCVLVASRLAGVWLDMGDVETARRWTQTATSHVRSRFGDHSSSAHLSVQTDLALIDGDFSAARRHIASMRVAAGGHHGGRREMDLLIYSLRLAQCEGTAVDDADVDRLMRWHLRARGFGRHDDAMECLWIALVSQRRFTLASGLLLEYVGHYRREARPCKHFLRMRSGTDPAWVQLPWANGGAGVALRPRGAALARRNGLALM